MIKRSWIIFLLSLALILPVLPRHTTANVKGTMWAEAGICSLPDKNQIEDRIKCYMPPPVRGCSNCPTPGFAVAIIKDDKPIYEGGFGFANLEKKQPITADTVFDIASLTKQFTAAGILMLMDEKRLTLETSLSEVFEGFPTSPEKKITVADLLTHQSGLPDYMKLYEQQNPKFKLLDEMEKAGPPFWYETMNHRRKSEEVTNEEVFEMIRSAVPKKGKKPGAEFVYSNSGYVVLAQIIEKLSPRTYKQFMHERIFGPLNMTHTTVLDEKPADTPIPNHPIPNHAFSYVRREGKYFPLDGYTPLNFIYGDGNIHSTLTDMTKWVMAIHKVLEHDGGLLRKATLMKAVESARERLDMSKPLHYGFGWFVATKKNITGTRAIRVIYHAGNWPGFHSYMMEGRINESGKAPCELTMIVLSNLEPGTDRFKNRPCHLARDLSKLFWGTDKDFNIILDSQKMWCQSDFDPCDPNER